MSRPWVTVGSCAGDQVWLEAIGVELLGCFYGSDATLVESASCGDTGNCTYRGGTLNPTLSASCDQSGFTRHDCVSDAATD